MEIPITKVVFDDEERRLNAAAIQSGWVTQGPYVREFEERFAEFTGARHAVATSSCTGALHLTLHALGIGPGDEVIVPAFSFVASANVVGMVGAMPVFCDVELSTLNLDPERLEQLVTPRTRALLPVHEFGLAADVGAIAACARRHGLAVVEDAACALGTRVQGMHAGRFGRAGCFSFHPRKTITTGQGGMVITDDDALAESLRTVRRHGLRFPDPLPSGVRDGFLVAECDELGFNYQMSDLQGALGVAQMKKAPSILERRIQRAERYHRLLDGVSWLQLPARPTDGVHSYQSFVCLFRPFELSLDRLDELRLLRNQFMRNMERRGVSVRQGALAIPRLSYYRSAYGLRPDTFPSALVADHLSLALPLYAQMTDEEQDYVVEKLLEAFDGLDVG